MKGEATVPVRYGEQHATAKIIVVDVWGKLAILGRNWLSKIRLDWGSLFSVETRQMFDPRRRFQDYLVPAWVLYKGMKQELH